MLLLLLCYLYIDEYLVYICVFFFFFFKQKTAYEMRISDWSSDVCSSDLQPFRLRPIILSETFHGVEKWQAPEHPLSISFASLSQWWTKAASQQPRADSTAPFPSSAMASPIWRRS